MIGMKSSIVGVSAPGTVASSSMPFSVAAEEGFYLTRKSLSVAKVELKRPEVWGLSTEALAAVDGRTPWNRLPSRTGR